MRLIDADKLNRKDVNCANVPMNFIDTAPTVEAIPKADYEARLKSDMTAMLTELLSEIEEMQSREDWCDYATDNCIDRCGVDAIIRLKIHALNVESEKINELNATHSFKCDAEENLKDNMDTGTIIYCLSHVKLLDCIPCPRYLEICSVAACRNQSLLEIINIAKKYQKIEELAKREDLYAVDILRQIREVLNNKSYQ